MKVQWRLISLGDGKTIAIKGEPFELNYKTIEEQAAERFADMIFDEQCKGSRKEGTEQPMGILHCGKN